MTTYCETNLHNGTPVSAVGASQPHKSYAKSTNLSTNINPHFTQYFQPASEDPWRWEIDYLVYWAIGCEGGDLGQIWQELENLILINRDGNSNGTAM